MQRKTVGRLAPIERGQRLALLVFIGAMLGTTVVHAAATLTLSPTSGVPGSTVRLAGDGFRQNSDLVVTWNGQSVPTLPERCRADNRGNFDCTVVVPADAFAGVHEVRVEDTRDRAGATASFLVVTATATPPPIPSPTGLPAPGTATGAPTSTPAPMQLTMTAIATQIPPATLTAIATQLPPDVATAIATYFPSPTPTEVNPCLTLEFPDGTALNAYLSGGDQSVTAELGEVQVRSNCSVAWRLDAAVSRFAIGSRTLQPDALQIGDVVKASGPPLINTVEYPVTLNTDTPPVPIFAPASVANGNFTLVPHLTLRLRPDTYAGDYTGVLTLTIVATP